jgi:hypothetical protein
VSDQEPASAMEVIAREIIAELGDENIRLREALEKIERGGPWDSKAIARAALRRNRGGREE